MTPSKGSKKSLQRYTVFPNVEYGFEAADDEVADAVVMLLGGGWMGWTLDEVGPGRVLAVELVATLDESDQSSAVASCQETNHARRREVIAALRTVEIDSEGRKAAGADPDVWHVERAAIESDLRTSALATADAMEQGA